MRVRHWSWNGLAAVSAVCALGACATGQVFAPPDETYARSSQALEMPMRALFPSDVGEYTCDYAEDRILYNGNTTLQLANCLLEAPSGSRTLAITSSGGNVDIAIYVAELVHGVGLDVEVIGWCASSCANYVLPAAERVILDQHSVVFVHGAPTAPDRDALVAAISKAGCAPDSPGFDDIVDDNMKRSELTYRLHGNFMARFNVGAAYYDVSDIYSGPHQATKPGASNLVLVDPAWLAACLPGVEIVAEPPNLQGLQGLFPRYNLVSFSQARGDGYDCSP